jgi:hypothetical protein
MIDDVTMWWHDSILKHRIKHDVTEIPDTVTRVVLVDGCRCGHPQDKPIELRSVD